MYFVISYWWTGKLAIIRNQFLNNSLKLLSILKVRSTKIFVVNICKNLKRCISPKFYDGAMHLFRKKHCFYKYLAALPQYI